MPLHLSRLDFLSFYRAAFASCPMTHPYCQCARLGADLLCEYLSLAAFKSCEGLSYCPSLCVCAEVHHERAWELDAHCLLFPTPRELYLAAVSSEAWCGPFLLSQAGGEPATIQLSCGRCTKVIIRLRRPQQHCSP